MVRAFKVIDGQRYYGAWSNAKGAKVESTFVASRTGRGGRAAAGTAVACRSPERRRPPERYERQGGADGAVGQGHEARGRRWRRRADRPHECPVKRARLAACVSSCRRLPCPGRPRVGRPAATLSLPGPLHRRGRGRSRRCEHGRRRPPRPVASPAPASPTATAGRLQPRCRPCELRASARRSRQRLVPCIASGSRSLRRRSGSGALRHGDLRRRPVPAARQSTAGGGAPVTGSGRSRPR